MIINPYLVQPSGPSYGALTTAWIAATGETDLTILGALNTLETDLNTYGLTAKMKALYPMVGGTAAKHKFNFMDARDLDAAYRLVFNGGWTHSSTGALPNGSNAYADTKFQYDISLTGADNAHLSYYSRTNASTSSFDIGAAYSTSPYFLLGLRYGGTTYYIINGATSYATVADTDSRAFYIGSRNNEGIIRGFKNGTQNATITQAASIMGPFNVYIGAVSYNNSPSNYSNKECALSSIGDGLNATDAANFYTAVQAFQTTLSRQV
jgi:hypothetical protein